MSYPGSAAIENEIVLMRQQDIKEVTMPTPLQEQVIAFIRELREDKNLDRKPGVRASIGVVDRAKTTALVRGNSTVQPEDVQAVIASVLTHRMSLKPSVKYLEDPTKYILKKFDSFARDHDLGGDP